MPPARLLLFLALGIVVSAIAITGESFWIDELMTAHLGSSESWDVYRDRVAGLNTSDIQMPLYMAYLRSWHQFFGGSEYVLRLANVPWLLFGVYGLWRFLRTSPDTRDLAIILLLASPFAWFYLNEARPYAMQLGASCVVLGLAMRILRSWKDGPVLNAGDLYLGSAGLILLAGSSLLSVPWIGSFLALFTLGAARKSFSFPRRPLILSALACALALAGLGYYYLGTLLEGARAATLVGNSLASFAYAFYELLGFGGLGPGRNDLRAATLSGGLGAFALWQWALLGLLALVHAFLALVFTLRLLLPDGFGGKTRGWLLLLAPPLLFMALLAVLKDFRVLGRHLTPLLPVLCVYFASSLQVSGDRRARCVATGVLLTLLLTSCLMQRFAPRHRKDDYRQAASLARSEVSKGRSVLWVANLAALPYYNLQQLGYLPLRPDPASPPFLHIFRLGHEDPVFKPALVILSKPDIHDATGYARAFIRENKYHPVREFPGFTVYSR